MNMKHLCLILTLFLLLSACTNNSASEVSPTPSPASDETPVEPAEVSILENEGDIEITIPEDMESDGF